MGQTTGPEPLDHRPRLIAVVADDQAAEQRAVVGREDGCRSLESGADTIRCRRGRAARRDVTHPVEPELADHVLPGDPHPALRLQRPPFTTGRHRLAGSPRRHALPDRPTPHPDLEPFALDLDEHA